MLPRAAIPAILQPEGGPKLPSGFWSAEWPQHAAWFLRSRTWQKKGFAVRQRVAFPSAQRSVEQTPLKQLVPVCDHRSPLGSVCVGAELCTRESDHSLQHRAVRNTAKSTVTSSYRVHKPSADLSGNISRIAGLVGNFPCWALQKGQWPQLVLYQSWAGKGNWWTEQ